MLEILADDRTPNQIITAIYNAHRKNMIAIKLKSKELDLKPINFGVRQGCPLSLLLLALILMLL
jgi:hypothetical protein